MVAISKPTVGGSFGTWGVELNTALDTLAGAINAGTVVSVAAAGIDATGTTDVTTALQNLIDASPTGATVRFDPGTYLISAPLVLQPARAYIGAGHHLASGATIKQADGANITNPAGPTGLLVTQAWANNQSTCDPGLLISNLAIDGNSDMNPNSTASGIVLTNFWARVEDTYLYDIPGHAVLLTDVTADASNVVTNTCSENRLYRLKIDNCAGDGIHQTSANNNSNQDGYLADCLISGVQGGIIMDRSAGWVVRRNHLYAIRGDAIGLGLTFATIAEANYIEDFGDDGDTGTYYTGIGCNQLDYRGSHIINNFISCSEPGTSSHYTYIAATANSGQADAHVIVTANMLRGNDTNNGIGIVFQHQTGGVLTGLIANNFISNLHTDTYVQAGDSATG